MTTLTINCLVHGDDADRIFCVEISSTKTVGLLKTAIKNAKQVMFRDVDARTLNLYQVSLPIFGSDLGRLDDELRRFKLEGLQSLLGVTPLSAVFSHFNEDELHIIVKAPSPANTLTLNCLFHGEGAEDVFPVQISSTRTVGLLKKAIKDKNPATLYSVDASALNLYQVSLPIFGSDLGRLDDELRQFKLKGLQSLLGVTRLSAVFSHFNEDELHIIVKAPSPAVPSAQPDTLTLNCLFHGEGVKDVFPVQISSTQTVGLLKDAIKNKNPARLYGVDASALRLYSIPLPNDDEPPIGAEPEKPALHDKSRLAPCITMSNLLAKSDFEIKGLDTELRNLQLEGLRTLYPTDPLSGIFSSFNQCNLHIIVETPTPGAVQRRTSSGEGDDVMTELDQRFQRTCRVKPGELTPSAAAKSTEYMNIQGNEAQKIYDCRYAHGHLVNTSGPPIQLFNPAFAYFSSKAFDPNYDVPLDFIRNVRSLMNGFSAIHPNERSRACNLKPQLDRVLGRNLSIASNADKTAPGVWLPSSYEHLPVSLIFSEEMNEVGDGGSDPSVQASFSFLRVYKQAEAEKLREQCCCPTFLIAHAGPWLAVMGGIITSKCIIQRLTDFMWIPVHCVGDDDQYLRIGRVLYALKESISQLDAWYTTTLKTVETYIPSRPHPRFFPTPDMYLRDGMPVKFKYMRPLEMCTSCMTYLASTLEDQPIKVVVKFVTKYGEDAHREMAMGGFAPKLLYCGLINVDDKMPSYGKLRMVVMDYVEGQPLYRAMGVKSVYPKIYTNLEEAIELLHRKGFVFGDFREQNIMIAQEGQKVQLIDFDWAGKEGEVRYPVSISGSIEWADGVKGLELIRKQHDLFMLGLLRHV